MTHYGHDSIQFRDEYFLGIFYLLVTAHSPVVGHINTTIQGLTSIKVFGMKQHFIARFHALLNRQICTQHLFQSSYRWIMIAIDIFLVLLFTGNVIVALMSAGNFSFNYMRY